jgi:hypothetical protein
MSSDPTKQSQSISPPEYCGILLYQLIWLLYQNFKGVCFRDTSAREYNYSGFPQLEWSMKGKPDATLA